MRYVHTIACMFTIYNVIKTEGRLSWNWRKRFSIVLRNSITYCSTQCTQNTAVCRVFSRRDVFTRCAS